MIEDARDLTRGGGAGRIALSYLAFTGMVAAGVLLMKLVVALEFPGRVKAVDF
jgi:hypothetical protein